MQFYSIQFSYKSVKNTTNTTIEPIYEMALPDYEEITLEKGSTTEDVKTTKNEAYDFIRCGVVSMTECPAYQSHICADL